MFNHFFTRKDTSILGTWWWTIDRWLLTSILLLVGIGIFLSFAASPSVAYRLNLDGFYFVKKHLLMLMPSLVVMFAVSMISLRRLKDLSLLIYCAGLVLLICTLFWGIDIKGARRWINIVGFQIQPSEFMKPAFAILVAWSLTDFKTKIPNFFVSLALLLLLLIFFLLQPDLGMTLLVTVTWIGQVFIAGLPMVVMGTMVGGALVTLVGAYFIFPHVAKRIDQFLEPTSGDPRHDLYQVTQSLEAFMRGGAFGRGPGEGLVKKHIPDVHADFVFAVAGEEFGIIFCLLITCLFAFIVVRSLARVLEPKPLFITLATAGIAIQFGIQTLINLGSTLHLIPTKGMTLPFISYGGSSLLALGCAMGMLLCLTKKRHSLYEVLP